MELHEDRNKASTTQPTPPKSIKYARVALAKNRLGKLCIPKPKMIALCQDYVTRITIIMIKSSVTKLMVIVRLACSISCTTKSWWLTSSYPPKGAAASSRRLSLPGPSPPHLLAPE